LGQFDQAIAFQMESLKLIPENQRAEFAERLKLFETKKSYHIRDRSGCGITA